MEWRINKPTEARPVNSNMIGEVDLWVGISFRKDEAESGVRTVLKTLTRAFLSLELALQLRPAHFRGFVTFTPAKIY